MFLISQVTVSEIFITLFISQITPRRYFMVFGDLMNYGQLGISSSDKNCLAKAEETCLLRNDLIIFFFVCRGTCSSSQSHTESRNWRRVSDHRSDSVRHHIPHCWLHNGLQNSVLSIPSWERQYILRSKLLFSSAGTQQVVLRGQPLLSHRPLESDTKADELRRQPKTWENQHGCWDKTSDKV